MKNISLNSLKDVISQRVFDWYMVSHCKYSILINSSLFFKIKYHELYNPNGQGYVLAPNGFSTHSLLDRNIKWKRINGCYVSFFSVFT